MPNRAVTLILVALPALSCLAAGCSYESSSLAGYACDEEGAREGDRACVAGVWVSVEGEDATPDAGVIVPHEDMPLAMDAGPEEDMSLPEDMQVADMTSEDMAPDMGCELPAEEVEQACAGLDCGGVEVMDSCGQPQRASCGACLGFDECVGNMCVCVPETDAARCEALSMGKGVEVCGVVTGQMDRCGEARDVDCMGCEGALDTCVNNECASCVPEGDGALCMAQGAECGEITAMDQCGQRRTVTSCGSCTGGDLCVGNTCRGLTPLPVPAEISSDDLFGWFVTMDGPWLAVGAPRDEPRNGNNTSCGVVYLYRHDAAMGWQQSHRIIFDEDNLCNGNDERFGQAIALDEDVMVVAAPFDGGDGRLYVYRYDAMADTWPRVAVYNDGRYGGFNLSGITSDADLGTSLAVHRHAGGYVIAAGAPRHDDGRGRVYVLRCDLMDSCTQDHFDPPAPAEDSYFGQSLSFSDTTPGAEVLWVGEPNVTDGGRTSGKVHRAVYSNGTWSVTASVGLNGLVMGLTPADEDDFGARVATSAAGIVAMAPGRDARAGLGFARPFAGGAISLLGASNAGANDRFGAALVASGLHAFVGAPREDGPTDTDTDAGAAYFFEYDVATSSWSELLLLRAPGLEAEARFGISVTFDADWLVVGAPREDSTANNGGAVYVLPRTP